MERKLSIVVPVYNEEESLEELYNRIIENVNICINEKLISDFELIFVDDGSSDSSVKKMHILREQDNRVHMIVFRKNFGKAAALQAAFRNATGGGSYYYGR